MGRTLLALILSGSVQSKVPTLNNLQRTGSRVNYGTKLITSLATSMTSYLVIPGADNLGVLNGQQPEEVVVVPLLELVVLP